MRKASHLISFSFLFSLQWISFIMQGQPKELSDHNIVWKMQSINSGESMPCGGGDIGLNVWVEKGEILFYISRSGTFDENNALLKLGRIRIKLSPDPFDGNSFRQELVLKDGNVKINSSGKKTAADITIWVDVLRPVIHVDIKTTAATRVEAIYENWRSHDKPITARANNENSWKWGPQGEVKTFKDEINFVGNGILFYHRNKSSPVFDATVKQQGLEHVKDQLFNPQQNLQFGGRMQGSGMQPAGTYTGKYLDTDFQAWKLQSGKAARSHSIEVFLHTSRAPSVDNWMGGLDSIIRSAQKASNTAAAHTREWWKKFWERSFVFIAPSTPDEKSIEWQSGRNYQLFRYMLGCNAYGNYPTKFNGGLFTYDPSLVDTSRNHTPDFRNWGGGTHTAQNQRLVYFPMLRSGDLELMKPQFNFYLRILKTAELRSKVYWNHGGACFTEQMENFGLPNPAEYSWKRPIEFDKGVEYNAWLEYQWDTALEFCLMMLEVERYGNRDISEYIPFIESCLTFFDQHYQYLAQKRGIRKLDANGHLILFPGSGAETYKMAYNASSTIAALQTVTTRLLELPSQYLGEKKRKSLDSFRKRIPPIPLTSTYGHTTIAPAKLWERINNVESPQLYPVFPWSIYGFGRPDLEIAINTWKYDKDAIRFRSHIGWKQDNIFAARLGLRDDAALLTFRKLENSGRRFPAFWGPGFDWTPDHNWGGSGMIGLQEMLLQSDGRKIFLFPAWPRSLDVHFKLHAPYETTVEGKLINGKIELLTVIPEERRKDVVNMLDK